MDYWSFVMSALTGPAEVFIGIYAGILIGGLLTIGGAYTLYDKGHGGWNFLFIPAMIIVIFLAVMFFVWLGSNIGV